MITIIDYGVGNLGSVANMIKKVGGTSIISSDKSAVADAEKLILCGVGSFDDGITNLKNLDLIDTLNRKVLEEKTPILGICLGMQLFTERSEEGKLPGLGWFDAETVKFRLNEDKSLRTTHMGWNVVNLDKPSRLFSPFDDEEKRFYFVHRYHVKVSQPTDSLTSTSYGYSFCSALEKDNIVGVQFHPEKSHKFGIQLFKNFINNY